MDTILLDNQTINQIKTLGPISKLFRVLTLTYGLARSVKHWLAKSVKKIRTLPYYILIEY